MKRRDNNRGFTLVELIIAVAILAIAISPLIANFIQSSKMNLKGRESLDAMNLAQDIMEGLSGYTADEVDECVDNVLNDASGTKTLVGNILPKSAEYGTVTKVSGASDDVLQYNLSDVKAVGSVKNVYNAEIILDPTGTEQDQFNNQIMADISEINQYYDAVFTVPTASDTAAAIDALKEVSTSSLSKEQYYGKLKRETEVIISNMGTEDAPNYKVSVIRTYSAAQGEGGVLGIGASDKHTIVTDNICRMDADRFPRSVYIYFKGIEGATRTVSERKERIIVENRTGKDITVYLIRTQETDSLTGDVQQDDVNYGNTFGCEVAIVSKDMNNVDTENVYLVSNLRYDLNAPSPKYNFRTKTEEGHDIYNAQGKPMTDENGKRLYPELPKDENGDTITVGETKYLADRAKFYYNTAQVTEEKYLKYISDGYGRKDKNTIYKVTINLYDSVSGAKIATYDGGLSN